MSSHIAESASPVDSAGSPETHDTQGGKPGRKKNPNTQAARRDQNRIAQREFRLRKQQKIRDLEARVELLSGDKEDTYVQLRHIIRELMSENQTLRNLLRELSNFIGNGLGGNLSKIGWSMDQFEAFISKLATDTAHAAFEESKRKGPPAANADDGQPSSNKKQKTSSMNTTGSMELLSDFISGSSAAPLHSQSPSLGLAGQYPLMGNPLMSDDQPPNFLSNHIPPSVTQTTQPNGGPSDGQHVLDASSVGAGPSTMFPPSYGAPVNMYSASQATQASTSNGLPPIQNTTTSHAAPSSAVYESIVNGLLTDKLIPGNHDDASFTKKNEAGRLIKYHLDNFRRNPSYCLPRSLNPTLVQRTVAHEQIIDAVPFPDLRDRLILLKERFSLPEVMHLLFLYTTIHGDDVLQHGNWEIQKPWMDRFPFLVDEPLIAIANRWRRERAEPELKLSDFNPEHN